MQLGISIIDKEAERPAVKKGIVTFKAAKPVIIQPGEIQKIITGLVVEVPENFVLEIMALPELINKGLSVFPARYALMGLQQDKLQIPFQNSGRNQINILPGQEIAKGFVTKLQNIDLVDIDVNIQDAPSKKTRPQKKNNIDIEIK